MRRYFRWFMTFAVLTLTGTISAQLNWSAPRPADHYMELPSTRALVPRLATNDTGGILSVRIIGQVPNSLGSRVVSSYSGDFGQSWTTTTLVNTWETSETLNSYFSDTEFVPYSVDVVYAGNNTWICQWLSTEVGGVTSTEPSYTRIAKSLDNGLNWVNVLSTGTVSVYPSPGEFLDLASDGSGTIISTWVIPDWSYGGPMFMMKSTDFGDTWSDPYHPHDSTLNVKETRLAWADGTWYHVFSADTPEVQFNSRSLEVARSADGGNTWDRTELHWQLGGQFTNMLGDVVAVNNTVAISFLQTHPNIGGSIPFYEARVIHSTDSGTTWSSPARLDIIPPQTELALATDREGEWVVLADPYIPDMEINYPRNLKIYKTNDIATTWTSTEILNPNQTHTIGFPTLISPAPSLFMAQYKDGTSDSDEPDVISALHSTDGGTSWSKMEFPNRFAPYYFSDSTPQSIRVKVADNGTIVAKWASDIEDGIYLTVARSMNLGMTWDRSKVLIRETIMPGTVAAALTYSGAGQWEISNSGMSSRSNDDGITWSEPAPDPSVVDSRDTSATSTYGTHVRVYYEEEVGFTVRSTLADESFTTSLLDSLPARYIYPDYPKVAVDWLGERQWIAVWDKPLSGIPSDYLSSRIFYSLSDDDGRTWSVPQRITPLDSDLPPGTGQNFPTVGANNGRTIVMWQLTRGDVVANPAEGDSDINFSVVQVPIVPPAATAEWELY